MMKNWLLAGMTGFALFCSNGCESGQGVATTPDQVAMPLGEDGIPNLYDNCPGVKNAPDVSLNLACDAADDCLSAAPQACNPATGQCAAVGVYCVSGVCMMQRDTDLDGTGDGDHAGVDDCDEDDDGDHIPDAEDNCPLVKNADQLDTDNDGAGNACDTDDDNDTILDGVDNCPLVANPNQQDTDHDGTGDACEGDSDGDGILDGVDNCPLVANPNQQDTDHDGKGDACDDDIDGDTILNGVDNCPLNVNADQLDTDGDHIGDVCDPDDDNDGDLDGADNCPLVANADQKDTDNDGKGDLCDSDDDGDSVPDANDNCPLNGNPTQADRDGDHIGDVCDLDCDGDGATETNTLPNLICYLTDLDGDGFSPPQDCIEGDALVHPGATEKCNNADDDCDGVTDEGCPTTPPECTVAADCDDADPCTVDTCTDTTIKVCAHTAKACSEGQSCNPANGQCVNDTTGCSTNADCEQGFYCANGTAQCYKFVDQHGRTPFGASGANGGPLPDGNADNYDWDGDGFCAVAPCVGSANPALELVSLQGGDCDDDPDDSTQFQVGTGDDAFMTDGSRGNNPSVPDFVDGFDNDCGGTVQ